MRNYYIIIGHVAADTPGAVVPGHMSYYYYYSYYSYYYVVVPGQRLHHIISHSSVSSGNIFNIFNIYV